MFSRIKGLAAAATLVAAIGLATPAQAQLVYLGNFAGNECGGTGGFSNCYATQTGTQQGLPTDPLASPTVYKRDNPADDDGANDTSTLFPSINGTEFSVLYTALTNNLSFTYTPGAGDPVLHYVAVKQSNGFALFYDDDPILAGSFNLSTWFPNNPGWSHITFFDTAGVPPVPEPATWAMMLLGFLGIGTAVRRSRKAKGALLQLA